MLDKNPFIENVFSLVFSVAVFLPRSCSFFVYRVFVSALHYPLLLSSSTSMRSPWMSTVESIRGFQRLFSSVAIIEYVRPFAI